MSPARRSHTAYRLAYTPEAVERLSLMEARHAGGVNAALNDIITKGWAAGVERIERNKYRLKLPRHHVLFRVFDDQALVLVEFIARRSEVITASSSDLGFAVPATMAS